MISDNYSLYAAKTHPTHPEYKMIRNGKAFVSAPFWPPYPEQPSVIVSGHDTNAIEFPKSARTSSVGGAPVPLEGERPHAKSILRAEWPHAIRALLLEKEAFGTLRASGSENRARVRTRKVHDDHAPQARDTPPAVWFLPTRTAARRSQRDALVDAPALGGESVDNGIAR